MDAELLNPSQYIKAVEFKGRDVTLQMTQVEIEELEDNKGKKKKKGLISFAKTEKRWVLNVTNLRALIAMFGRETNSWTGKRVTLYPAPNEKSETGLAIRVRGSPDLDRDITFTAKIGRDSPKTFTMKAVGKKSAPTTEAAPPPPAEDAHDPDTGEVTREPGDDSEELIGADGKPL